MAIIEKGVIGALNNDRRLTSGDIMGYCQVSRSTVLKWVKTGKLSAYLHPDGQYRVTRTAFVDFLKTYNMPIAEEFFAEASEPNEGMVGVEVGRHGNK